MKHLFGAGHVAERIIKYKLFGNQYCVYDNNKNMHGASLLGVTIESPDNLSDKIGDIIICTTSISEVEHQLSKMGLKNKILVAPEINEFKYQSQLDNYKGEFLVASGLPSNNMHGSSGGLYKLSVDKDEFEVTNVMSGSCHSVIKFDDGFAVAHQEKGIVILSDDLEIKKLIDLPLNSRCHGLAHSDNSFWVACSNRDSILEVSNLGEIKQEIFISKRREQLGSAQHHINDLCLVDDDLYVSMFSLSGSWKKGIYDGGVRRISLVDKSADAVVENLTLPHSVKIFDRSFIVLNSFHGSMLSFGKYEDYTFNGFLRGFDVDDSYFYFGESRNRNSTGLKPKRFPVSIDTNLQIVDRSYGYSRGIPLPSYLSEIHSVLKL